LGFQVGFIPGIEINKCKAAHEQNQGQKKHDHLDRCRKNFDKIIILS
jgi:hypothetical protein